MGLAPDAGSPADAVTGEARWPMAVAVIAAMVLTVLAPHEVRSGPAWVLPLLEGLLLVALIAGDPGAIDRRSNLLRMLSIALVAVLVLGALASTVLLIDQLIQGGPQTQSASDLLEAGAIVWLANNIAFALLYWELDGGGSPRAPKGRLGRPTSPFHSRPSPGSPAPGWRPLFIDYLYLGFTNATAFSPTDAMPLTPRAKIAMTVQSLVSLAILGLIIARAVNVLT